MRCQECKIVTGFCQRKYPNKYSVAYKGCKANSTKLYNTINSLEGLPNEDTFHEVETRGIKILVHDP